MKWYSVRIFDEIEDELLDLFRDINVPKHIAGTIIFLASVSEATSKDIEIAAGLRQPEVSRALQYLELHGWLARRTGRYCSTGRPRYIYSLAAPVEEVFLHFVDKKYRVYESQRHSAEAIGALLNGMPEKAVVPEYAQDYSSVSLVCENIVSSKSLSVLPAIEGISEKDRKRMEELLCEAKYSFVSSDCETKEKPDKKKTNKKRRGKSSKTEKNTVTKYDTDVSDGGEFSVSDDSEFSVSDDGEFSVSDDDEISVSDDDEISVSDDDEISVSDDGEFSVSDDDEISVSDDSEFSVSDDDEISVSEDSEFFVSNDDDISVSEDSEFSVSDDDEISVSEDSEFSVSDDGEIEISSEDGIENPVGDEFENS